MKKLYEIPQKKLSNYGIVLAISLLVIAALLFTHYPNNIIIESLGYSLLCLFLLILVFVQNFSKVRPLSLGILLSIIVSVITFIITIIYILSSKGLKGTSPPVAYFIQLFLAKFIKKRMRLEDEE